MWYILSGNVDNVNTSLIFSPTVVLWSDVLGGVQPWPHPLSGCGSLFPHQVPTEWEQTGQTCQCSVHTSSVRMQADCTGDSLLASGFASELQLFVVDVVRAFFQDMKWLLDAWQNHQTRGRPLKISPKPSTPCWKEWLATWTSQLSPTSQALQVMTT